MEVRVNCPDAIHLRPGSPARRADRKRKLSLNSEKNAAHCWRCGYGSYNATSLIRQYGLPVPSTFFEPVALPVRTAPLALPPGFSQHWQTEYGRRAWQYLRQRGLDAGMIAGYGFGYCAMGPYANRVVLPIYQHGVLRTWQARDMTGLQTPKYLGPRQSQRGAICFNLDRARHTRVLVLTEGPFDALAVPAYGVALLGTHGGVLSAEHVAVLQAADPYAIIVSLDPEAIDEQRKVVRTLWGLFPRVETWQPPTASDLGACPPNEKQPLLQRCMALAAQASHTGSVT